MPNYSIDFEVTKILLKASDANQAIRELFQFHRGRNKRYSLSLFCRLAGIPSKGYLSEVLNNKRVLHPKYKKSITKGFRINDEKATYLELLIEIAHEAKETKLTLLKDEAAVLKKVLQIKYPPIKKEIFHILTAVEVIAAFGLFENSPTEDDILSHFGPLNRSKVKTCLEALYRIGVITKNTNGELSLVDDKLLFSGQEDQESLVKFLTVAIQAVTSDIPKWISKPEDSYFQSTVISVDRDSYKRLLKEFRRSTVRMMSNMETGKANQLVRFNVQICPMGNVNV